MDYRRITAFSGIGQSHKKLKSKTAAIIGAGAIGSNCALLLAKSGIGKLIIADRDIVEPENLPATPYLLNDIGKPKAMALKALIAKANPETSVAEISEDIDHANIEKLKADIIMDCTDNLETRFLLNDFCMKYHIPLVHASALGSTITIFNVVEDACLSCIYSGKIPAETCETAGILPAAALIGAAMQANEAIKMLLGKNHEKNLVRSNIWNNTFFSLNAKKQKNCKAHTGVYEYLNGKGSRAIKMCGSDMFQIKGRPVDLKRLNKILKGKNFGHCITSEKITVFENGRALIRAKSEREAKSIYSRIIGN